MADAAALALGKAPDATGFIRAGSGAPVLLIHGVGMGAAIWRPQIALMQDRFDLIAIDMLGHGGSPLPPQDAGLADFADQAIRLLDHLSSGKKLEKRRACSRDCRCRLLWRAPPHRRAHSRRAGDRHQADVLGHGDAQCNGKPAAGLFRPGGGVPVSRLIPPASPIPRRRSRRSDWRRGWVGTNVYKLYRLQAPTKGTIGFRPRPPNNFPRPGLLATAAHSLRLRRTSPRPASLARSPKLA